MNLMPLLSLPISDPVLKFLIILIIILGAPLILNRLRIPPIIGLIIAGAAIGPNGFNLVLRDSSIIMSGTAGLLYIMFLAGLEININDFRRNSGKSIMFGMYTFIVPIILGFLSAYFILGFSLLTSILLGSMMASHTLIAYPLISKLGIGKNLAVTITVGGTMITDTLALLVLTVIVGMTNGVVDKEFWIRLAASVMLFAAFVSVVFPLVTRWFLKKIEDGVTQYVFILALVFLGAYLAEVAGLEPIIGAFLAGLAINRLIPETSSLMNRISFVGNAIFIPFFLLGVGMLIDYRAFYTDLETVIVGLVMILVATSGKWIAAWLAQKSFRFSLDQRRVIFGLSNAQAAATLAAVTVGHAVILGYGSDGEPLRLLNDAVLNGTILMILVTCTIASLSAQKGAQNIALADAPDDSDTNDTSVERIMVAVKNPATVNHLVDLCMAIKGKKAELFALNVIGNKAEDEKSVKLAKKVLHEAVMAASSSDNDIEELLRYDISRTNAIVGVIKEQHITDLIMDLPEKFSSPENRFLRHNNGILSRTHITTYLCRTVQPLATIKRHLVIIPERAERELGFSLWIRKIWVLAANTGSRVIFYCSPATRQVLADIAKRFPIQYEIKEMPDLSDFSRFSKDIRDNDFLWIIMSRRDKPSFHNLMPKITAEAETHLTSNSFILLYPAQSDETGENMYFT